MSFIGLSVILFGFGLLLQISFEFDPRMVCGRHCLDVIAGVFDRDAGVIQDQFGPPRPGGDSLAELASAAEAVGLRTLPVRTSVENLMRRSGRFAVIAHVDEGSHFILILDVAPERQAAQIFDPRDLGQRNAVREIDLATLDSRWDGKALLVSPDELLPEEQLPWAIGMWLRAVASVLGVSTGACGIAALIWHERHRLLSRRSRRLVSSRP